MKKLGTLIFLTLLAFSLSACAPVAKKSTQKEMHVKCPACGYEFTVPEKGQ